MLGYGYEIIYKKGKGNDTTTKNNFRGCHFLPPKVGIGGSFSIGGGIFKPPLLPPPQ